MSSTTTAPRRGEGAARARRRPRLLPPLAALAAFALFTSLGVWQLERAEEKRALEATYARRAEAPPVPFAEVDGARPDLEGRRVEATGTFDAQHQFLLDNVTRRGVAGYHVLTPLRLGDGAVLVNRGWVPAGPRRSRLPSVPAREGREQVAGTLAVPAERFLLGPAGYEASGKWPRVVQAVRPARMAAALGYPLRSYLIRLDPGQPGGFVREWRPHLGLSPARHQGYAVQWFALALTVLVVYVALRRRRRGAGAARTPA